MTRLLGFAFLGTSLVAFTACEEQTKPKKKPSQTPYGYQGGTQTTGEGTITAEPSPTPEAPNASPDVPPQPTPTPEPTPVVTAQPGGSIPYGTPVAGKPGFVTSPHAPYSGYVDVRGFPPGSEVKDPYTGKIFLVP